MYKLALRARDESASSSGVDSLWQKLWSLQIPPKAKKNLWRAVWDILPHGHNLSKKGINNAQLCQRCGLIESNSHVLKDCFWARKVWNQHISDSDVPHYPSFRAWLGSLMELKSKEEVELFSVCAWQIWNARNELCFEKTVIAPELCFKRACDILAEYKSANRLNSVTRAKRDAAKWEPPAHGTIKINVDAAVNNKENRIGLGVVARDADGKVVMAASKTAWPFIESERAELEAFLWAAHLIQHYQWKHVIVEGDAQVVVEALQSKLTRGLHNQILVSNILDSLADVDHITFNFCYREANGVAHRLAKWASTSICSLVWLDNGPYWISDIVFADCN